MARRGEEFLTAFLNTIGQGIKERRATTERYKEEGYDAAKLGFRTYTTLKGNTRQMKDDIDYLKNALGQTSISDEEYLAIAGGKAGISLKALREEVQKAQLNNLVPNIDASTVKQLITLNNFVAPRNEQGVVDLDYGLEKLNGLHQQIYQRDTSPPSDKKTAMSLLKAGFALNPKQSAEEYLSKAEYLGLPVNELISVIGSTGKGRLEGLENVSTNYEALSKLKPLTTKQISNLGNPYFSQIKAVVGDDNIVLNNQGLFDIVGGGDAANASLANQIKLKVGRAIVALQNSRLSEEDYSREINRILTTSSSSQEAIKELDFIIENGNVRPSDESPETLSSVDPQLLETTLQNINFDSIIGGGVADDINLNRLIIPKIKNISDPVLRQAVVENIINHPRLNASEKERIKNRFIEEGINTSGSPSGNAPPPPPNEESNLSPELVAIVDMFFTDGISMLDAKLRKAVNDAKNATLQRDKEDIIDKALKGIYSGRRDKSKRSKIGLDNPAVRNQLIIEILNRL